MDDNIKYGYCVGQTGWIDTMLSLCGYMVILTNFVDTSRLYDAPPG